MPLSNGTVGEPTVENRAYYDEFAKTYEKRRHAGYHLLIDELESELVIPHVAGKDALEVGCGTGLILQRVAPHAKHAKGIDLSPGMIEHAKNRGLDVEVASATALPFPDASFDVVYSFKVLSHVTPLQTALAEMARVCKPGGRVFIELYNKHSLRYAIRRARGGESIGSGLHDNQVYVKFFSPAEMRQALPPTLKVKQEHGVRVFTTLPAAVSWPVVGTLLRAAERRARTSALARFGGFLVLECEKLPTAGGG